MKNSKPRDQNIDTSKRKMEVRPGRISKHSRKAIPFTTFRKHHALETSEDYVELIDDLIQSKGRARIRDIASYFGISHVTAIRTIQRLQKKGYVHAQPRKPITLTASGKQLADLSRSRHAFLLEYLISIGVPEEVAVVDAEGMEHHVSIQTLDAFHRQCLKMSERGKDVVANASHELRIPVTIIKGFAETLQDFPELPRDSVADIVGKIVRNCQRMDTLVKNLMTLADLENLPELCFQKCDLVMLAEACRQTILAVHKTAQIAIEKSNESIPVAADPDILELAILNLLDNAVKYSNPPAKITIKLEQEAEQGCISISDQGIGIPSVDLRHIFERFYAVDKARSRRLGEPDSDCRLLKPSSKNIMEQSL